MARKSKMVDKSRYGLLPTPPLPAGLPKIELTENARAVFFRRYVRKDLDGRPVETPEETFWRVAYHVAKVEEQWGNDPLEVAKTYYTRLLAPKRFFPNSPTWTGAGTPLGQLAACFVLPISDDMGRKDSGIFTTLRNAALIQQTGGGNGFSFSRLRPKGTVVKSSAGQATGPVGFLRVYDKAFGEIAQGGSRRGANMAVLRVDHPDIEEFLTCKTDENAITNFNISVGITDAFMRAVENDEEWELRFPDVTDPKYDDFDGTIEQAEAAGIRIKTYKKVRARDLFQKLVRQSHHNGEPGVLFLDTANRANPVPHLYPLEATNPCFVAETRIATTEGLIPIQEMAESGRLYTIVTDNRAPWGGKGLAGGQTGTTLRPQVRAFKTRENEPVFRLRTRHGYTVVATADHPFLTPDRGYVALEALRPGDRVLLQSGEGAWSEEEALPPMEQVAAAQAQMVLAGDWASGHRVQRQDFAAQYAHLPTRWSRELGLVLGVLVGDGWLSPKSHSPVGFTFSAPALQAQVHGILRSWFGEGHIADRGSLTQLTYGRLAYEFFVALGVRPVPLTEKRVPESLWRAPREAVIGFLQGLFSADGSIQVNLRKQDATVRLASSSRALLEDVQLLLLNFGIVSRIHQRRAAGTARLPDGKGGQKEYPVAEQYELLIGRENRNRFARVIGFADPAKQARLEAFIEQQARGPYCETFEDVIVSIEPAGRADVYDLEEPETHSLIANGLVCHNCGEQWLGPYENCCLGSINLAQHITPEGGVDWDKLRETTELAVRFLDDVVEANAYVPSVPQLKEAAHRARRIGLGVMGLADLMYANRVRYGAPEAQEFAALVMEFIRYHAMRTSIELARERGPFPAIKGSIYDPENLKWQPPRWPQWLGEGPSRDWGRPPLDWDAIVEGIRQHGIRNAAQTTIAPTGTIATVTGVEGYGCEPVFALAYIRHVNDNGKDLQLTYVSPSFMAALKEAGLNEETRQRVIDQVLEQGTCQHIEELPDWIRHTFVVSMDITAEEHVRMQAALQNYVDNSISKTINFPADATPDDVAEAYMLAWKLGCKGLTVYVTGSRDKVVLETKATAKAKGKEVALAPKTAEATLQAPPPPHAEQPRLWNEPKKPRPSVLPGWTYRIETPLGRAFVTINENGDGQPFEVFVNTSKAGSETAAISEAIGRLISYILRLSSTVSPRERLEEVWRQLNGIGGGRAAGFGPNRVRSLADGIAQALRRYLDQPKHFHALTPEDEEALTFSLQMPSSAGSNGSPVAEAAPPVPLLPEMQPAAESGNDAPSGADKPAKLDVHQVGDICPECGAAAVVYTEGCARCYACGYSECK